MIRKFAIVLLLGHGFSPAQQLEVRDGWHWIDRRKFFIKGIGYETHCRPGQAPWIYSFDADLIRFDLARIRDAGFNTIRTWGALTEEEMNLVEESGLKILFGIWIDPAGNFGDAAFRTAAFNQVQNVLRYTPRFRSIIGYLIMNEPQVEHIHDTGAEKLVSLWNMIVNLIHSKHRGVPVSFANTMIGDFIDMDLFDLAAYNAYIYNPVTLSRSHGYSGFLRFLKSRRSPGMPMVITEFGLSVSPGNTGGQYGYGGNTEEEQAEGDLIMYRGLIEAGVQGGCVFQYHDGWFKAGNEKVHDSSPEEWFGLIAFSNASDKHGTPRPAWNEFTTYNKAFIVNPKNGGIYSAAVPVEVFPEGDAASFFVQRNEAQIYASSLEGGHFEDEMNLTQASDPEDAELVFTFLDSAGQVLKTETITVLLADENLQLPGIDLEITPASLNPGKIQTLKMEVSHNPVFDVEPARLDYVMHPHIGFDPGVARSKTLSFQNNSWSGQDNFFIPTDCRVATFGAGMTVWYGKFSRRIYNQRILTAGDWPGSLAAEESSSSVSGAFVPGMQDMAIYPNPFNSMTNVRFLLARSGDPELSLYDALGRCLKTMRPGRLAPGFHSIALDGSELATGVYVVRIHLEGRSEIRKMVLIR